LVAAVARAAALAMAAATYALFAGDLCIIFIHANIIKNEKK